MKKTIPFGLDERKEFEKIWNNYPALKYMGVRLDLSDENVIRCHLDNVTEFHRGGLGTNAINGAVLAGTFDLVIGLVGIVNSDKHRVGTVQMSMNFLKPVFGDKLVAESTLTKKGKSLIFARAEIYDEKGDLCATAEGISSVDFGKPQLENYVSI